MPNDANEPTGPAIGANDREWFLACAEYVKSEPLYYSASPEIRAAVDTYLRARADGHAAPTAGIPPEMIVTLLKTIETAREILRNWPQL